MPGPQRPHVGGDAHGPPKWSTSQERVSKSLRDLESLAQPTARAADDRATDVNGQAWQVHQEVIASTEVIDPDGGVDEH